jgi:glycosyl transferase family 25
MSENIDKIIYINLKKREDKKAYIENQLNTFVLKYERFDAIEYPTQGNVGCSLSHLAVLKLAKERGYKNILILEDDFTFIVSKNEFENTLKSFFDNNIEYNVCMFYYDQEAELLPNIEFPIVNRIKQSNSTVGYLVNNNYYDILIKTIENSIPKLIETKEHWNYAIDTCWRELQKKDMWYGFCPIISKHAGIFESDCTDGF